MFNITLTKAQIDLLGQLLAEHPYKLVSPLIAAIGQQVAAQAVQPQE